MSAFLTKEEMKSFTSQVRELFPMYQNNPNLTYLDSGATSLKPKCVIDAMNDYYFNYGVNIHRGVYKLSYEATKAYDEARSTVAKFINAKPKEIVFTKNVSESLNLLALMLTKNLSEGDEIMSTYLEHHSSCLPYQVIAKEKNLKLTYINLTKDLEIDVEDFKKKINDKTKILAITYVSNVLGYKTKIEEFIKIAHEHNILVVVDAAQAVQHKKIDVKELDCDFLCFSSHKMLGPTGIGVLYGKKELLKKLKPVFYGGDMNEEVYPYSVDIKEVPYCFETGTPPIAEAIGLKRAIELLEEIGFEKIKRHEESLIHYLKMQISSLDGVTIYNPNMQTPVLAFNIDGVHPHDAASFFDEAGVCVRAGHHCAQLLTKHLGVNGTLRASCYIYNDYEDIDKLIMVIKEVVKFFN